METHSLVPGTGTRPGVMTVSLTEGFLGCTGWSVNQTGNHK